MFRSQCLLAFVALAIHHVNSWDIAITTGDDLEFYSNGNRTNKMAERARDLTALAYDAVFNMLLFVDKENDNASIFSYHLATNTARPLVGKKSYENIQGIAFDPVTGKLFWTDSNTRSIYSKSLMPGSKTEVYGTVMIKLDDEIPRAIAVDSCRGWVYWTNTNIRKKPSIERARFDGSERQVIVSTDIYKPESITIDQKTRKLYWVNVKEGIHYSIESSDLDGKNRVALLEHVQHQPNALAVNKDDLYWIDWGFETVWKLPKNPKKGQKPEELFKFVGRPFGIVANYQIADQTAGIPECEALVKLSENKTVIDPSFIIPSDAGVYCLHGVKTEVKIDGKMTCKCSLGYTGDRCEIPVCQNYCLQGSCSWTAEGLPKCSCKDGFAGARCEVDVCQGHCLNNARCLVRQEKPVCECRAEFEGQRCENVKVTATPAPTLADTCNCTQEQTEADTKSDSATQSASDGEFVETCSDGWDSVRDPIIMVMGILCGLLCMACAYLITKILQLKKRPRIKKRIIVNKNVTPLTARPDQCEITIENCCNMNICETPCFEPRSTIRPTLLDAKPGKEEKKNLIANMELPDDY